MAVTIWCAFGTDGLGNSSLLLCLSTSDSIWSTHSVNEIIDAEMKPIYPFMTYRDYLTYIFVAGNVVGAFVCYEILLFASRKLKNDRVHALLTEL